MYGYLENFSSLFDENPSARYMQYFEKFEEMVQKCAVAAVRDTRLTWKNNQDFNTIRPRPPYNILAPLFGSEKRPLLI